VEAATRPPAATDPGTCGRLNGPGDPNVSPWVAALVVRPFDTARSAPTEATSRPSVRSRRCRGGHDRHDGCRRRASAERGRIEWRREVATDTFARLRSRRSTRSAGSISRSMCASALSTETLGLRCCRWKSSLSTGCSRCSVEPPLGISRTWRRYAAGGREPGSATGHTSCVPRVRSRRWGSSPRTSPPGCASRPSRAGRACGPLGPAMEVLTRHHVVLPLVSFAVWGARCSEGALRSGDVARHRLYGDRSAASGGECDPSLLEAGGGGTESE
jgi:hypothetical protein